MCVRQSDKREEGDNWNVKLSKEQTRTPKMSWFSNSVLAVGALASIDAGGITILTKSIDFRWTYCMSILRIRGMNGNVK